MRSGMTTEQVLALPGFRDRCTDASSAVCEDRRLAVRDDHPLDRQLRDPLSEASSGSRSASSTNTCMTRSLPVRTSPVTSVACSWMKKTICYGSRSSSNASIPAGNSSVVAGFGIFRQTACGGVQTDAPYRSTTSAVQRWCAPCVRSTRICAAGGLALHRRRLPGGDRGRRASARARRRARPA